MVYIPPKAFETKFTCPHCEAIAKQTWRYTNHHLPGQQPTPSEINVSICDHCQKFCLWHKESLLYPDRGIAQPANADMDPEVLKLYNEAASIASKSPRAAAALLRLAVQVLCGKLGEPGKNINEDIGSLVKKGLPAMIQQALDVVRVTGNNAVHPGQIDVDDEGVVTSLFSLLNLIVQHMVTLPSQVNALYQALPQTALDQIKKRDQPIP
jgi:Domain of unknown function (DUF4145)